MSRDSDYTDSVISIVYTHAGYKLKTQAARGYRENKGYWDNMSSYHAPTCSCSNFIQAAAALNIIIHQLGKQAW